jgi:hypothetical protein
MQPSVTVLGPDDRRPLIIDGVLCRIRDALADEFPPIASTLRSDELTVEYGPKFELFACADDLGLLTVWVICAKAGAEEYRRMSGGLPLDEFVGHELMFSRLELRTEGALQWAVDEMLKLLRVIHAAELLAMFEAA